MALSPRNAEIATMKNDSFKIFTAVQAGFVDTALHWRYLVKLGGIPLVVQFFCNLAAMYLRLDATLISNFLINLPAALTMAWLSFAFARRLVLREDLACIRRDPLFLSERMEAMRASVLLMIVFLMGMVAISALMMAAAETAQNQDAQGMRFIFFALLGLLIWFLRYGLMPVAAAVGYPVPDLLKRLDGFMISLRVLAMTLFCALPVQILFSSFTLTIFRGATDVEMLDLAQRLAGSFIFAVMSLTTYAVLTAAAVEALRQMLGAQKEVK